MFLIGFLPSWFFYSMIGVGFVTLLLSRFIPIFYRSLVQITAAVLIGIGLFMSGASYNETEWKLKIAKLEKDIEEANARAAVENVKIVEKVVVKKEYYRTKGQNIIEYVDREVIKYNDRCEIPQAFIDAHDEAVKK